MPTVEEVLQMARGFIGVQGEGERTLRSFCAAACERARAALRSGADVRGGRESLLCGLAMQAAADYAAADNADDVEEFSAGELKIRRAAASRLEKQAKKMLAPFCRGGFRLTEVCG